MVCKSCLRDTIGDEEFCPECKPIQENDFINKMSNKAKEINNNRKFCVECGARLGILSALADSKHNLICSSCSQKHYEEQVRLEKERLDAIHRERIGQMKLGKSFVVVKRTESFKMAAETTELVITNHTDNSIKKISMKNSDEVVLELVSPNKYTFVHKTKALFAGTTPFTINLNEGESYYIDYKPVAIVGPLSAIAHTVSRAPVIEVHIRKREIIKDGDVVTYNG